MFPTKQGRNLGKHMPLLSMARKYPRFLFSHPKNSKSEGPFVVHCLQPRIIFQVVKVEDYIQCIPLDDNTDEQTESIIRKDAEAWLRHQIKGGEITL